MFQAENPTTYWLVASDFAIILKLVMNQPLCFNDLKIGDSWKSRGRTVTESDVVSFACLTGDFDPLHVDREFAKTTPFGKPIAHGLLGLSWVAGLGFGNPSVQTLAFLGIRNWEFLKPIFVGDTLTVLNEVIELRSTKGKRRGHVIWRRSLLNQVGLVVQRGELETLVACRETLPEPEMKLEKVEKARPETSAKANRGRGKKATKTK